MVKIPRWNIGEETQNVKQILDQKIGIKNYFVQKMEEIVLVGDKFHR